MASGSGERIWESVRLLSVGEGLGEAPQAHSTCFWITRDLAISTVHDVPPIAQRTRFELSTAEGERIELEPHSEGPKHRQGRLSDIDPRSEDWLLLKLVHPTPPRAGSVARGKPLLGRKRLPTGDEPLWVVGYPLLGSQGGDRVDVTFRYEDGSGVLHFDLCTQTDQRRLKGLSGAPIVDKYDRVVAMLSGGTSRTVYGIRPRVLVDAISTFDPPASGRIRSWAERSRSSTGVAAVAFLLLVFLGRGVAAPSPPPRVWISSVGDLMGWYFFGGFWLASWIVAYCIAQFEEAAIQLGEKGLVDESSILDIVNRKGIRFPEVVASVVAVVLATGNVYAVAVTSLSNGIDHWTRYLLPQTWQGPALVSALFFGAACLPIVAVTIYGSLFVRQLCAWITSEDLARADDSDKAELVSIVTDAALLLGGTGLLCTAFAPVIEIVAKENYRLTLNVFLSPFVVLPLTLRFVFGPVYDLRRARREVKSLFGFSGFVGLIFFAMGVCGIAANFVLLAFAK